MEIFGNEFNERSRQAQIQQAECSEHSQNKSINPELSIPDFHNDKRRQEKRHQQTDHLRKEIIIRIFYNLFAQ